MHPLFIILLATSVVSLKGFDGCRKTASNNKTIKAVSFLYHIPYISEDGSKTDIDNTYEVYQYGDLTLHKFNYRYDSFTNDVLEFTETRHRFLVHHKDSAYGYLSDPVLATEGRIPVDSLRQFRFENPLWDTIAKIKVDSTYRTPRGDLVKIYNIPPPFQNSGRFTYYFYYTDSLKGIRESFSKTLEKLHGMKLYKIRMVTHPYFYEPYQMMLPIMEAYYEMREIQAGKLEEIEAYFRRYERMRGG